MTKYDVTGGIELSGKGTDSITQKVVLYML